MKSLDVFDLIIDKIEIGKANSIKQLKDKVNKVPKSPGTFVYKLVGLLNYIK